jgi:hypothetical protein
MANAGVRGPPIERLVRTTRERAYLERQVHGWRSGCSHTVTRRSSCRTIRYSSTRYAISSAFTLSPPNRALVLSIDEKSQIQALDCEQPVLPMNAWRTRTSHAQLRAAWYDLAVCRIRCRLGVSSSANATSVTGQPSS